MQNMPLVVSVHSIDVVGVYVAFYSHSLSAACLLTLLEQYLNTSYAPTITMLLTETTKRRILHRYICRGENTSYISYMSALLELL